ncbi:hypothetical protein J2T60_001129 [Natronospira proteinivora]|uniref:Uncharacterized protein n=1 Tax=Natronospira proteinivora TaxID=1807133 RepID=A0ABT1G789_9GAMM|nr:hypothetical protein [Natronospira proteinivora]
MPGHGCGCFVTPAAGWPESAAEKRRTPLRKGGASYTSFAVLVLLPGDDAFLVHDLKQLEFSSGRFGFGGHNPQHLGRSPALVQ